MRSYYTDYVKNCMRYYARNQTQPPFKSYAQRLDWESCRDAILVFPENERELLLEIYKDPDTIADNVLRQARRTGIDLDDIWELVERLEKGVARRRGLI